MRPAATVLLCSLLPLASFARAPLVMIDPGHGGPLAGAAGPAAMLEKDLALSLSRKVRTALLERGVSVLLTREEDTGLPLADRVAFANRHRPELFISLHANSMPTRRQRRRVEGIETFFLSASASYEEARNTAARENEEAPETKGQPADDTLAFILADLQRSEAHADSSRAAYAVHQRLLSATRATDRGVQQAPFFVLMGVEAPAILVEVGYLSHPVEGRRLADPRYQERLAKAIAEGVVAFLAEVQRRDGRPDKVAQP